MSREKQIEEMAKILLTDCEGACTDCEYYGVYDGSVCIPMRLANVLYNAGYRKQEWISVDEALPEDVYGKDRKKITVLVCTESGKVSTTSRQRIVKFDKDKLEWVELDIFEWSKRKRVTHWMPLPEVPKMKGGAE